MKLVVVILFVVAGLLWGIEAENRTRVKRSGISYVWTNGIIPYDFRSDFPERDRAMFLRATKYIEERTCVRFKPKGSGDRYWLTMVLGKCCGTPGGRIPELIDRGQEMTMSSGLILPYYLHELGHTFGLPHEQDRPDRDEFIYWDRNKKPDTCQGGFANKVGNMDQAAIDIPFDYVSLMADWTECYWPHSHTPKNIPMGPGGSDDRTFSVLDIERINAIHDCRVQDKWEFKWKDHVRFMKIPGCFGYRFRKLNQLAWNTYPVPAGYDIDKKTFYVCRVYHEGHLLVGKSIPDDNNCWIGWDEKETKYQDNFSVLTNPRNDARLEWVSLRNRNGRQVIEGGRTKDRETIYIGRCLVRSEPNSLIPGFYLESSRELQVAWAGGVVTCTDFEVLVCNDKNIKRLNF